MSLELDGIPEDLPLTADVRGAEAAHWAGSLIAGSKAVGSLGLSRAGTPGAIISSLSAAAVRLSRCGLCAVTLLAGCVAQPTPGVNPDLLAAAAGANPTRNLELLREQGERFAHVPVLAGNRVDLLINGPASFAALAEAIRSAHTRIDIEL